MSVYLPEIDGLTVTHITLGVQGEEMCLISKGTIQTDSKKQLFLGKFPRKPG